MAFSPTLLALVSFIYRISINLPDVPYSVELRKPGSQEFKEISQQIFDSINFSLKDVSGVYNLTVREFRYQQVIGTIAAIEILSLQENEKEIRRIFEEGINSGHINWLAVAPEGFEFYEFKVDRTKNGKFDVFAAKPTVKCPDGTLPEYSLHGSTYCWSHSVCPTGTACIQSQCCKTAIADQLRKCPESKWECGDGRCLHMHNRCDGLNDCDDRSDEILCENEKRSVGSCTSGEYQCDSGECIPQQKQCDRHYDCQDGTDELKCDYFLNAQRSQSNGNQQKVQEQRGHDSHRQNQVHENSIHARPDQNQCSDQEFRCPYLSSTKCVHYDKLCDGMDDCGDGSDETKCESGSVEDRKCEQGEFQCSNGQCISESKKCNHHYDCDDGTDETTCDYFKQAQQTHRQNGGHSDISDHERQLAQREEQESRREAEERRREHEEKQREHEERRRKEEFRRREEESRRRTDEERRRLEEERRRQEVHTNRISENAIQISGEHEVKFKEEYDEDECLENEFMCGTGECIDRRRVCDSRPDCLDNSDEYDCDGENNHDRIWPDRTEPPRHTLPPRQPPQAQPLPQQHPDVHSDTRFKSDGGWCLTK